MIQKDNYININNLMEKSLEKLFNELDLMNENINNLFQKGLIEYICKNNIDLFKLINLLKNIIDDEYHPYFEMNDVLNILYKRKYNEELKTEFNKLLNDNNFKDIKIFIKNLSQIENYINNINTIINEFKLMYSKKLIEVTLNIDISNKNLSDDDSDYENDSENIIDN